MATFKVVLAGCGGISDAWFSACKKVPEIEIAGLVDIKEENAEKKKVKFELGKAKTGTDIDIMLDAVKPDAVFDCTIPAAHVKIVSSALAHGCHVLGEKPLADTLENAKKMVDAAKIAGKTYAVCQNYRHRHDIRRLVNYLGTKDIGEITTLNCDFYKGAHFDGFRKVMKHVLLLDMSIHAFDASRFISKADPVSVYCKEWNPKNSWYEHGASAVCVFTMSNGIVFTYRGSWTSEGFNTSWNSKWHVIGEKGSVQWDGEANMDAEVVADIKPFHSVMNKVAIPEIDDSKLLQSHDGVILDFFNAIKAGKQPQSPAEDNIKSLAMVFAAIKSAENGTVVKI